MVSGLVIEKYGKQGYTQRGAYNVKREEELSHENWYEHSLLDREGNKLWDSHIYITHIYTKESGREDMLHFDCIFINRRFMENVETNTNELINQAVKLAKKNKSRFVLIKFASYIPNSIIDVVERQGREDLECELRGIKPQWIFIKLTDTKIMKLQRTTHNIHSALLDEIRR